MKYAFVNGIILDGTKDMVPVKDKVIVVYGDTITDIADTVPEGSKVIDLKGKYIMPGLINMHVHLAGNGSVPKKQRDNTKMVKMLFSNPVTRAIAYQMVKGYARIELLSGVTTIRTVGGLRDYDSRVRDDIIAGKAEGPRILAANEGISVPHGHMAGSVAVEAHSIPEALAQVDNAIVQGADLIKLMITGGVLDAKVKGQPGELKMPADMVKAICDYAHEKGLITAAHVESPEGVKVALANGVDSIEHGAAPDEEMIRLFQKTGAFLTVTLSPALPFALFDPSVAHTDEVSQYNGRVVFEGIQACAKAALENNIPVALGNDVGCPWITQYDFWRELVYFHKFIGVSNQFALYTATLRNAQLAGIGNITGSIEKGKCADMIVTEGNPLEDLTVLRNVKGVMARGKWIENPSVKRKSYNDKELDPFL